jgi:hypothetical protein
MAPLCPEIRTRASVTAAATPPLSAGSFKFLGKTVLRHSTCPRTLATRLWMVPPCQKRTLLADGHVSDDALQGGYPLGPKLRRRPVRSPLFALLVRVHVHHAHNHDRAVHLPLWAMSRTSSSLLDDFITLTWAVRHEQGPHQRPHCTLLFFFSLLPLCTVCTIP